MSIKDNFPIVSPSLNLDFSNTKVLDPRITFSRPTSAVYYDGQTVTKAEENLLKYSQELDNGFWFQQNISVFADSEISPDGTTTTELFTETTTNGTHYLQNNNSLALNGFPIAIGNNYVASVFFKKGTGATAPDWVSIYLADGFPTGTYANFNLSTVAVGNKGANVTANIYDVGNGWYRCSISAESSGATSTGRVYFTLKNNIDSVNILPSYVGQITSNIFIWGAQLEQSSTVGNYIATESTTITLENAQGTQLNIDPTNGFDTTYPMTFELASNTSLVVKVKGSDGTVRSATLTLA